MLDPIVLLKATVSRSPAISLSRIPQDVELKYVSHRFAHYDSVIYLVQLGPLESIELSRTKCVLDV